MIHIIVSLQIRLSHVFHIKLIMVVYEKHIGIRYSNILIYQWKRHSLPFFLLTFKIENIIYLFLHISKILSSLDYLNLLNDFRYCCFAFIQLIRYVAWLIIKSCQFSSFTHKLIVQKNMHCTGFLVLFKN